MSQPTLSQLIAEGSEVTAEQLTQWVATRTDETPDGWLVNAARIIFGEEVLTYFHNGELGEQLGGGLHIGYSTASDTFLVLSTEDPKWFVPNPHKHNEIKIEDRAEWERELIDSAKVEVKEGKVVNGYNIVPPNTRSLLHVHTPENYDPEGDLPSGIS